MWFGASPSNAFYIFPFVVKSIGDAYVRVHVCLYARSCHVCLCMSECVFVRAHSVVGFVAEISAAPILLIWTIVQEFTVSRMQGKSSLEWNICCIL